MGQEQATTIGVSQDVRTEINKVKSDIDASRNEIVIEKLISQYDGICLQAEKGVVRKVERLKKRDGIDLSEEEMMAKAVELLENHLSENGEEG